MSTHPRIAVVGGGAGAVCLLETLSHTAIAPSRIWVFESGPNLWRGRAYQHDLDLVLLNLAPEAMSVRPGEPGHFARWLSDNVADDRHLDQACGIRFAPRTMFGDYLTLVADEALARLRGQGCQVDIVRENVESATRCLHRIKLTTDRGTTVWADDAVLCVGGSTRSDPYGLTGAPGFVPDPYPLRRTVGTVDPEASAGVLGTGLTGVDTVLALVSAGHRGPIRMLSRSGVLPAVRQRPISYRPTVLTPDRFDPRGGRVVPVAEIVELVRAELAAAGEDIADVAAEITALRQEDPVARLRRQLREVDAPSRALRILQQVLPNIGPDLWSSLSEQDKDELLHGYHRALLSLCCPLPPRTARRLLELLESGWVELVPGLRRISRAEPSGFVAETGTARHRLDVVLNAISSRTDVVPDKAAALVRSLVASGIAQRHPRGGVHVLRATSRTVVDEPSVYALGDVASGSLLFTFGLPSIVDRVVDIVEAIRVDHSDPAADAAGTSVLEQGALAGGNRQ